MHRGSVSFFMKAVALLFLGAALTVLAGCSQPAPTVEEKILMKGFASYVAALTFDEVCNGTDPKARYDFKQKNHLMLMGNQQMLVARIGGLWYLRHRKKSINEGVAHLFAVQRRLEAKTKKIWKLEGCDSEKAQAAAKAYRLYSETSPAVVMALIDRTIKKEGGTVTPPEATEALEAE